MADHTYKDFFGDGYTTYHDDGTTSHTYKDFFGDGVTTYHSDGSTSHSYQDFFGDGVTTYHSDGSTSHTYQDFIGDGYTTYNSDGSTSHTYQDFFGDGYTTYTYGGSSPSYGSYVPGSTSGYPTTYSGGYGGYYGGGSWSPGQLGVLGIILTVVAVGGTFYLTDLVMGAFPWMTAVFLGIVIVSGIFQRNRHNDADRQDVWYRWAWILTALYCIFTMLYCPAEIGSLEFLGTVIVFPTVFLLFMGYVLIGSLQPLEEGCGLEVVLCIASAILCIMRFYGFGWQYYIAMDIVFVVLAILIAVNTYRSAKECKLAIAAAPLCAYALFVSWQMLTGFYGLSMIPELVSRLF